MYSEYDSDRRHHIADLISQAAAAAGALAGCTAVGVILASIV